MHTQQSQVPFVDLRAQYRTISQEISEAVSKVITESDFILGRQVGLFQEEFAAFCEAKWAIGVDSGTSALELALRAYEIGPGDEVITAANSFIASALGISYKTVANTCTTLKDRLAVARTTDLVRVAIEMRLLEGG